MQRGGEFIYKKKWSELIEKDQQHERTDIVREIEKELGVDKVIYPTTKQYAEAIGFNSNQLCLACTGQTYPTGLTLDDVSVYSNQRDTQLS
jgi:glutamine phosphoribosylpyrophosphate amidotransferase